jgi:hypothetical protein
LSHYSKAQKPKLLAEWATIAFDDLGKIERLKDPESYPVLVYTGLSGISAATALSMEMAVRDMKFGMCYVRKPKEECHGSSLEMELIDPRDECGTKAIPIFVDDFIASGDTMRRCADATESLMLWEPIVDCMLTGGDSDEVGGPYNRPYQRYNINGERD